MYSLCTQQSIKRNESFFFWKLCIAQTQNLSIIQLLTSLGNPSEDNNCNLSRFIAQTQTLSIIFLLPSLGNPSEDNSCNFERGSLTKLFL